jgi:hypothetical protein
VCRAAADIAACWGPAKACLNGAASSISGVAKAISMARLESAKNVIPVNLAGAQGWTQIAGQYGRGAPNSP